MVRIFLTGYMGAGKTTLGKAFARYMNIPFIDLDWYIEERFHKTVGELFIERGETPAGFLQHIHVKLCNKSIFFKHRDELIRIVYGPIS